MLRAQLAASWVLFARRNQRKGSSFRPVSYLNYISVALFSFGRRSHSLRYFGSATGSPECGTCVENVCLYQWAAGALLASLLVFAHYS